MQVAKRSVFVIALIAGLLAMWTWSGEAKRPKAKRLRAQVAELQATVARLQSQVNFQERSGGPVGVPGLGLCEDPCAADSDGDGIDDCEDYCPCEAGNEDGDGDGLPNCIDPCPDDPTDACSDPCRMDSDGDGTGDCDDPCPWDPNEPTDTDGDTIVDCQDPCPDDPTNACLPWPCPLLDQDGDGVRDCVDPCPWGEANGMPCVLGAPTGVAGGALVGAARHRR